jgi:hypothetical protein
MYEMNVELAKGIFIGGRKCYEEKELWDWEERSVAGHAYSLLLTGPVA